MNYIKDKTTVELTNRSDLYPGMMLYSYLVRQKKGETKTYDDSEKETLIVLQEGKLTLSYEGKSATIERVNVFDDAPVGLHVCKGVHVEVSADTDSEYLLFMTENEKEFATTLFTKENVVVVDRGAGQWNECATRSQIKQPWQSPEL